MRCPNCGAFVEDGKAVCTMCGTPINNNNSNSLDSNFNNINGNNMSGGNMNGNNSPFNTPQSFGNPNYGNNFGNMNTFNSNNVSSSYNMNQAFSGNPNANPSFSTGSAFGSGSSNMNQGMSKRQEEYEKKFNSYQDLDYKTNVKKEDKDIFDFFSENKTTIKIVACIVAFIILGIVGYKYYQYRTKPVKEEPVLLNLYFEVDSSLQQVASNSSSNMVYNKSGGKGSACSISVTYGSTTSGDHVQEYFSSKKKLLDPERDSNTNVVDELKIFTPSDSSMTINSIPWYYLNIFYKPAKDADPTVLKYKYLTTTHKGYYYDIELVNNSNDAACNASLDNFAKSLKFIDT